MSAPLLSVRGGTVANEKNLKPVRTKSEARERGKNGGIASGKKRREQKTYREIAKIVLSSKVENEEAKAIAKQFGIDEPDAKTLTLLGMVRAAAGGSHNAFDRLMELTGEKEQDSNADVIAKLDSVIGEVDKLAE